MFHQDFAAEGQYARALERSQILTFLARGEWSASADRLEISTLRHETIFSNERFNDIRAIFKHFRSERLDMKSDGRLDISEGFFVGISLANYNALNADRISDIAVRMFLDDNFY